MHYYLFSSHHISKKKFLGLAMSSCNPSYAYYVLIKVTSSLVQYFPKYAEIKSKNSGSNSLIGNLQSFKLLISRTVEEIAACLDEKGNVENWGLTENEYSKYLETKIIFDQFVSLVGDAPGNEALVRFAHSDLKIID